MMNWLKKLLGTDKESAPRPEPKETPKKTLQIEELEERITPNAFWGD